MVVRSNGRPAASSEQVRAFMARQRTKDTEPAGEHEDPEVVAEYLTARWHAGAAVSGWSNAH